MFDPISRLRRLEAFRARLARMHDRVGMVFFMPETRDRFRARLYRKWVQATQQRAMLLETIHGSPELLARYRAQYRKKRSMSM